MLKHELILHKIFRAEKKIQEEKEAKKVDPTDFESFSQNFEKIEKQHRKAGKKMSKAGSKAS